MTAISGADLILNSDGSIYHLNLLPEQIGDVIITVGDPDRVYRITRKFDAVGFEMKKREFVTQVGTYRNKRLTVMSTGIGTDNIELFMTELDALVNVDLKTRVPRKEKKRLKIIRIGTSGALREEIPVGTHLCSAYAIGMDALMAYYRLPMTDIEQTLANDIGAKVELPFVPYVVQGSARLRQQIGFDILTGNTVTTPGFFAPQGREIRLPIRYKNLLNELRAYHHKATNFSIANFEMETAAYYAMGRLLGHETLSLNAIIVNRMKNTFSADPEGIVDALIDKVLDRI